VLIKVGGSIISDKADAPRFKKTVCRRIMSEIAKMKVPVVITHGAGSFGHPPAKTHEIGQRVITPERRAGISETLAAVGRLHAEVVEAAQAAGLRPVSVPLHFELESDGNGMVELPISRIQDLVEEGFAPILPGTVIRDDILGWRIISADELMAALAPELTPRLAIFATNVEGVYDRDPSHASARVLSLVRPEDLDDIDARAGSGDDVTGRMRGKLEHAFMVAGECPTWIVDGTVRGRIMDVLKGKIVPGTRIEA
jgi:isopentenyl phosphate kinase